MPNTSDWYGNHAYFGLATATQAHAPTQHLRPLVLYMQHVFTTHCYVVVADIITKGRTGTLRHQYKRHQSSMRSNIKAQESSQ